MKIELNIIKEFDVRYLKVSADVRYWEDSSVNGVDDEAGDLMPCRVGDSWSPLIDIETGYIVNWTSGNEAKIHYKICDAGEYSLLDVEMVQIASIEGYVIDMMCPKGSGYGDYIIMDINKDGLIDNWRVDFNDFTNEDD